MLDDDWSHWLHLMFNDVAVVHEPCNELRAAQKKRGKSVNWHTNSMADSCELFVLFNCLKVN